MCCLKAVNKIHKDATLIKQEQQSQVYKDTFLKMSKIK